MKFLKADPYDRKATSPDILGTVFLDQDSSRRSDKRYRRSSGHASSGHTFATILPYVCGVFVCLLMINGSKYYASQLGIAADLSTQQYNNNSGSIVLTTRVRFRHNNFHQPMYAITVDDNSSLASGNNASKMTPGSASQLIKPTTVAGSVSSTHTTTHQTLTSFPATTLPSDSWRPMVITECVPGMPQQYAPCLVTSSQISNLQVAEELIYPDFAVQSPKYLRHEHASLIEKQLAVRFRREQRTSNGPFWYYYLNQHGRNLVFSNATYNHNPPAQWSADNTHCMGGKPTPHIQFARTGATADNEVNGDAVHDSVMFAASPDSYSFQHWSDRVAMMLVQTQRLRSNSTKFVAMQPRTPSVADGWRFLANVTTPQAQILPPDTMVRARSLIFACDTPLIHPYLMQRSSELMLAAAGLNPNGKPLSERKVVLLATRMNDKNTQNGGRRWLNYQECIPQIQQLLNKRNQGERLEEWDYSRFQNHTEVMRYWSTEVRAVVGTHGGALYNLQYAVKPTMAVEIWPVSPDGQTALVPTPNVIWEICSTKGLQHWALPIHTSGASTSDINVPCGMVVSILMENLGKDYAPVLEPFYQGTAWSA